jgi:hypothetical protein
VMGLRTSCFAVSTTRVWAHIDMTGDGIDLFGDGGPIKRRASLIAYKRSAERYGLVGSKVKKLEKISAKKETDVEETKLGMREVECARNSKNTSSFPSFTPRAMSTGIHSRKQGVGRQK